MPFAPNARQNVIAREEKEARLKAFITRHSDCHRAAGVAPGVTVYRLLALSVESPVALAVRDLMPELAAAGIRVEALFVRESSKAKIEGAECRFVSDLRLLDAHEQLVLDRVTAWIGDCMRRDPLKRDAYELYSESPVTAGHAARSFAQIWRAAGPSGSLAAGRKWVGLRQASLFEPSLIAGAEAMVATPHLLPVRH
ncbi:hypothetical protein [Hyphomicrobium sp.]|uniref:hypothetical protein n=1 Tax=Hyphomicrobium sp. TaxID=82 RepID=UPI0025C0C0FF|nr:hypothetical protein [Hyphomicrobium sp.]MCC7250983.1 hypothetical protein [Hyphomicrobium sp.]